MVLLSYRERSVLTSKKAAENSVWSSLVGPTLRWTAKSACWMTGSAVNATVGWLRWARMLARLGLGEALQGGQNKGRNEGRV